MVDGVLGHPGPIVARHAELEHMHDPGSVTIRNHQTAGTSALVVTPTPPLVTTTAPVK